MTVRTALFLAFLALSGSASAQTVLADNSVEFTPSPDHSVLIGTTPVVSSYEMTCATQAAPTVVVVTKNLGKPVPASGKILVVVPELDTVTPGITHACSVWALGPAGRSVASVSNPFVKPLPMRVPAGVTGVVIR